MEINNLIDRCFTTVSVLEDTRDVSQFLQGCDYLAVVDEESKVIGIVTLKDLNAHPESRNVIDCDIQKPNISLQQNIIDVFHLMKAASCNFLPVYDQGAFLGVISMQAVATRFEELIAGYFGQIEKAVK